MKLANTVGDRHAPTSVATRASPWHAEPIVTAQMCSICALFLQEVQSSLEFELKLSALWQIDFVAAAGLHQISCECGGGRALYRFPLVSVLHTSDRAHGSSRSGCFPGCLLRAGAPLDQSFLLRCPRF